MSELPADFAGLQNKIDGLVKNYLDSHPDFIESARKKDPALQGNKSDTEVKAQLSFYPGVVAIAVHEEAHKLYKSGESLKRVQARQLSEAAHSRSGIDIHPGTVIGGNCFIDHGTGDVIGETAKIGKNTLMYHGVTLGAYGKTDIAHRHPEIGDNCTISTGVDVLGHVKIGNNVTLSPHATLQGNNIKVGDKVQIGSSAKIADDNQIADGIKIGAGAIIPKGIGLIDKNIPDYSHVVRENGELKIFHIEDMASKKEMETLADKFKKLKDRIMGNSRSHSSFSSFAHDEQSRISADL